MNQRAKRAPGGAAAIAMRRRASEKARGEAVCDAMCAQQAVRSYENEEQRAWIRRVQAHACYTPSPTGQDVLAAHLAWLEGHARRRVTGALWRWVLWAESALARGESVRGWEWVERAPKRTGIAAFLLDPALLPKKPPPRKSEV